MSALPGMSKTTGSWTIIWKAVFTGTLMDFDVDFNSNLSGWGTSVSGQQNGTDNLVFQDGGRSHSGSSASVIAGGATWPATFATYTKNAAGYYFMVRRDNSTGKITLTWLGPEGSQYIVTTNSAIPMTQASFFHIYVNSGSFKYHKGALVDPSGTASFSDWDAAYDP